MGCGSRSQSRAVVGIASSILTLRDLDLEREWALELLAL